MKKLYLILFAALFGFSAVHADENILNVSGTVFEHENINPVPGHPVTIEIPPSNIFDGYFNEVFTGEAGTYQDEIILPEAVSEGQVFLSTPDCNGEIIMEVFDFGPDNMNIMHDFVLCDEPYNECMAMFEVMYLEEQYVQFMNLSIPPEAACFWEFGDGVTSEEINPVHQYPEQGVYEVCLTITSEELNCEDTFCMEVFIGNNIPCMAMFEWIPDPEDPLTIMFFNSSMGGDELSYFWEFGDGVTSEEMNPVHEYEEAGIYEVCLTISDGEECEDTFCMEVVVEGGTGECEAYYTWWPSDDPQTIMFMNLSWPENAELQWEFGDGTISYESDPFHTYEEPGTYLVCLSIFSENCQSTYCEEVLVENGGQMDCFAEFEWFPTELLQVLFENLSVPQEATFIWEFGDGTTSTEPNPVHQYEEAGVYEVCLTVSNEELNCEDTRCHEVWVGSNAMCEAGFEWFPLEGLSVQFENFSFPPDSEFLWEFGDGTTSEEFSPVHQYAESGTWEVCLTLFNEELNCEDVVCHEVTVGSNTGCQAYFEWEPLPDSSLAIQFYEESIYPEEVNFFWEFGDGGTSNQQNPMHFYEAPGVYEVCLTISAEGDCQDTWCAEVEVQGNAGGCYAAFDYQILEGFAVQFTDQSWPDITGWFWEFGDGTTSEEPNPLHIYQEPGEYEVCLTIMSGNVCEDITCQEIGFEIPGGLQASFEFVQDSTNAMTLYFFDTSSGNPVEWLWEFGDGTTSNAQNPVHTYAVQGNYEICLTVFGNENAADMYCTEILLDGSYISGIGESSDPVADLQIYPNPASETAMIQFTASMQMHARIGIYNSMMQKAGEIFSGQLNAGNHQIAIDLEKYSGGMYFIRLESDKQQMIKKLIIR